MLGFLQAATWLGAICAGFVLFITLTSSNGAPQEAAGCAMALAFVTIPYCVTSIAQRHEIITRLRKRD